MKRLMFVVLTALVGALFAAPATATNGTYGTVVAVHGVPGAVVDVYANDSLILDDFEYQDVSDPLVIETGTYEIEVFLDGDGPMGTPVTSITADLTEGAYVTVAAHLDTSGDPTMTAFTNDLSTLGEGEARLAVRHLANAPAVDILAGGTEIIGDLANPDEQVLDVAAGEYEVAVNAAGTTTTVAEATVQLDAGVAYLVHAVGVVDVNDLEGDSFALVIQTIEGLQPSQLFLAPLSGEAEVPPVDTSATGTSNFRLNDAETSLSYTVVARDIENVTQAHIHVGGPAVNGPVAAFLAQFAPAVDSSDGARDINGILAEGTIEAGDLIAQPMAGFDGTFPGLIRLMRSGETYVNVHTVANPPGEIRGQITPVPPFMGSPFTDDDDSVHEQNIGAIAAAGITKGCNPPDNTEFCPEEDVTRGQMAAFITRALNLNRQPTDFTDAQGSIFAQDIGAIAAAGITKGCNPPDNTEFCPEEDVTRGQMAAFLTRALGLERQPTDFTDAQDSIFAQDIGAIQDAGITLGCNPPENTEFCPDDNVTRAQMATFLARALGLGD